MPARHAGQHARETTRRKARFSLLVLAATLAVAVAAVLLGDLSWGATVALELLLLAGLLLIDRFAAPSVERWARGAAGEEHVGQVLEPLKADGWLTLHDVDTGRGNIDSVVIGPGGLFSIEVKSHAGGRHPNRIDPAWLRQAYAQKKWLEGVTGQPATPLLVFSRAYIVGRPVTRQRGVVVLPARMLRGHLRHQPDRLSAAEAQRLHDRLTHALAPASLAQ
jgi:Nuclease-related domain